MNQALTLDQLRQMPVGAIAALPVRELARLQQEAKEAADRVKSITDFLNGVLIHRFGDRATTMRQQTGKEHGLIRFSEEDVEIASELRVDPKWNQQMLSEIVDRIVAAGDSPKDYVTITYDVPESRYKSWPTSIRQVFEPARTVRFSRPSFTLGLRKQEVA
ncbi:MAG: hypothetical protein HQL95_08720 [Magnetococcales bacterium]|nr:hypothetical protein [Magnetococcales bacterium]